MHIAINRPARLATLLLLASACSGNKSSSPAVVLSPELRVLDSATLAQLSDVSADQSTLTFTSATPQLSALKPGNIIASSVLGTLLPDGMLRKVESVSGSGPVTVTTSPASITDAIIKGSLNPTFHLTQAQINTAGRSVAQKSSTTTGLTYGINDEVIYDGDGNSSTTNDQVLLSGSISIDPFTSFPIQINSGFTKIDLDLTGSESASLTVTANEGASFTKSIDLDTIFFTPLIINVGSLPVVFTPTLTFYAGIDGSTSASMTTGVNEQAQLDAGVGYHNGSFGPFNHSSADGGYDPPHFTHAAQAHAKAFAGARLSIGLWGVETAYVDADVYVRGNVEPSQDPWWSLYAGAEASAGIALLNYNAPLGHFEKLLASAPGGSSAAQITSWARAYSGGSSDQFLTVAPLANGGWLAGGSTLSFTSTPADAWLVATDPIGDVMWQRAYDDLNAVRAIVPNSDGTFLVATDNVLSGGSDLLKLDANGAPLWSKTIIDSAGNGVAINDMVALADGGVLLGGTVGSLSSADLWVAHLDAQGNAVWSFAYDGGKEDDLHALVDTGDGGCLAVGTTSSFTPLTSVWALRLGADGSIQWQKYYDVGGDIYAETAIPVTSGGFLVAGENGLDAYAMRLDSGGGLTWATDIALSTQDAAINGAAELTGGGFALAGSGNQSAWVVALSSAGDVSWSHQFGGAGDEGIGGMLEFSGVGRPLQATTDGSLVAAGASSSFSSGYDGWLLQLTPNGNVTFASGSGATQTDPSDTYSALSLNVVSTAASASAMPLSISDLAVTVVSTDATTISQAP